MYAIAWALYGQQATKNVTTLGYKGAEVVLHWNGMSATRAKNPERLAVNDATDEAAQKRIESTLEMTWEQFAASSFIQQGMQGSLLSLTPADQLRFVQRLAFGSEDPDVYRDRIYAEMKKLEESIGRHEAAIAALVGQRDSLTASIAALPAGVDTASIKAEIELQTASEVQYKATLSADRARLRECNAALDTLRKEKSHPDRRLGDTLKVMQSELSRKQNELTEVRAVPTEATLTEAELADIQGKVELCARQKVYLTRVAALRTKLAALGAPEDLEEARPVLQERVRTLTSSLEDFGYRSDNHKSNIQKIKDSADVLTCPACNTPLRRSPQGALVHAHTAVTHDTEMLAREQSALKIVTEQIKRDSDAIKAIEAVLAADVGTPALPKASTLEIVQQATDKLDSRLRAHHAAVAKNSARDARVRQSEKDVANAEASVASVTAKTAASSVRDEALVDADIRCHEADAELFNSEIRSSECRLEEIATRVRQLQSQLTGAQKEAALREQLDSCNAAIASKARECDAVQDEHTAAVRLKNLSDLAATECVASILDSINANAKYYLDLLFPDQGTSIRIMNEKENKTDGKKKAQFSTAIVHRGLEYSSLSELSGGEQSRACLAFQLAISDLYNSPILLLDEPFAGVHPTLRDECLEVLREVGQKKLILMAEHGAPDSSFDSIVTVK
jgi:DNA repair exonuclease SbcCD ATPase subunit